MFVWPAREDFQGFEVGNLLPCDRKILLDRLVHELAQCVDVFIGHFALGEVEMEAVAEAVADFEVALRKES